jgi:hypothetical protein
LDAAQLSEILALHVRWLERDRSGVRADLRGSDLSGCDLSGFNLRGCNLRGSNLRGCKLRNSDLGDSDLRGCNLRDSDLSGCNLRDSDLSDSDLRGCNLRGCNLRDSDLSDSDLRGCNLRDSHLSGCHLSDSNLSGSDLSGSDLSGCNLSGIDLRGCNLRGCNLRNSDLGDCNLRDAIVDPIMSARLSIVPEAGAFTGHKKLREGRIATLEIPSDAARSNAAGRKCRASKARVIAVIGPDGEACEEGRSLHDQAFVYRVGQVVSPHEWCEDRWQECAGGIHFYITMEEAKAHA